jgi:hypothetical protein
VSIAFPSKTVDTISDFADMENDQGRRGVILLVRNYLIFMGMHDGSVAAALDAGIPEDEVPFVD